MSVPPDMTTTSPPNPRVPRLLRKAVKFVGVSVYVLSVRIALASVALVLWVYFAINSAFVAGQVAQLATDALPGTVQLSHLQWGPQPGYLRVIQPRLLSPDGTVVLKARWLDLQVGWWQLVTDIAAGADPLKLRILKVQMVGPHIRIDHDDNGQLRLALAFSDPNAPPKEAGNSAFSLVIDHLSARDVSYLMDLNGTRITTRGGELDMRMAMIAAPGKPLRLDWETHQLSIAHAQMFLQAFADSGLEQLPGGPIVVQSMRGNLEEAWINGMSMDLPHMHLGRGDVVVKWAPKLDIKGSRIRMTASTKAPFFGKMLGSLFDCKATVDGGFTFDHTGLFTSEGEITASGLVSGFSTKSMRATIAMKMGHQPRPDDPDEPWEKLRVDGKDLRIEAYEGKLQSPSFSYRQHADGLMKTRGALHADDISLGQLAAAPVLKIPGKVALALQGRLSGKIAHKLDLRLLPGKDPALDMFARIDSDLQLHRAVEGVLFKEELPVLHLLGGLDYGMGPERGTTLHLRELALSDNRGDKGPRKEASDQWVTADGGVDFGKGGIELKTDIHLPDLRTWLQPLGVEGIAGKLSLRHTRIYGQIASPTVQAKLHGRGLEAAGWQVEAIDAGLGLRDGVLTFLDSSISLLGGQIGGSFDVHLFSRDLQTVHALPVVEGVNVRIRSLPVGRLLQQLGTRGYSGALDLAGGKLRMDLRDPTRSLHFAGNIRMRDVVTPWQKMSVASAKARMDGGVVKLRELSMSLPPARHGQAATEVKGTFDLDMSGARPRYAATLAFGKMGWNQLGYIAGLKMPMYGGMAGTVSFSGDTADIAFDADLQIHDLAWDKIHMGDGHARLVKKRGQPATITSKRFFDGFDLLPGSDIKFQKLIPMQIGMQLRAHDLDPMAFLGLEPLKGTSVKINGTALFGLDFRPGKDVFFVDAEMPSGGMEVEMEGGLEPLRNKGIARMMVLPDRVDIRSTRVSIGRENLEMCGAFLYPNEAKNLPSRLLLYLGGVLDVPRFGGLADSMAALDMRLKVMPSNALKGDTRAWCLRKPAKGALRIAGPFDALRVDGAIRLLPSTVVPRGFGKEVTLSGGGEIHLHTDDKQRMVVKIPDNRPIAGRIDDGSFRSFGSATLVKYQPDTVDFRFFAEDYEHIAPKEYSVVATPTLRFIGKDMLAKKPDMTLSGEVEVTEAAYIKSHDALRAIGKGVISREGAQGGGESFLDKNPQYKDMKLALLVNGRNIAVTSKFPFLRTDVELEAQKVKVGGTLGAMRVDGRLEIVRGSTITYELFKREFEVDKGYMDFSGNVLNPQLQITAHTDVPTNCSDGGQGGSLSIGPSFAGGVASSSRQDVLRVTVGVNGLLFDSTAAERGNLELNKKLDISLSSPGGHDQANLMALVLTGSLPTCGGGQSITLGYLTNELSEVFAKTLLSSFVKLDKFEVAPTIDGGAIFNFQQRLGKALSLAYKGNVGGSVETSEARFDFRISKNWSMEGLARSTFSTAFNQRIYSATLRYRVPLETFQQLFGL